MDYTVKNSGLIGGDRTTTIDVSSAPKLMDRPYPVGKQYPFMQMSGKKSVELEYRYEQKPSNSAIIDIDLDYFSELRDKLTKWRVGILHDISLPEFKMRFINSVLTKDQADKLADLGFVKGIFYNRKVRQDWDFPLLNLVQDKRREHGPPKTVKMARGWITTAQTKELLGGYDAQKDGYTGKGVHVAVCDTGFANSRQFRLGAVDVKSTLLKHGGYDNASGHGPWVCSCIAGQRMPLGDGHYIEGMAPDVKLTSIRCLFGPTGMGSNATTLKALKMAYESGADIINLSLGGSLPTPPDDPTWKLVAALVDSGRIVVNSAGNSGPLAYSLNGLADIDKIISVAAYNTMDNSVSSFSSRGPTADGREAPTCACPGGGRKDQNKFPLELIVSSSSGKIDFVGDFAHRIGEPAGTSMAAPHMSGMLVWWKQLYEAKTGKKLTTAIVKQILKDSATGWNQNEGYGRPTYSTIKNWLVR